MKIRFSALLAALMLLAAATASAQTATPYAPAAPAAPAAPCLVGDPFNLAALTTAISNPNPPTAPVTIGAHILVQTVRKGTLERGGEDTLDTGRTGPGEKEPKELPPGQAGLDNVPLRIFNTRTQFEFRVTFSDEMLRTIGDCHEQKGMSAPGGPVAPGAVEGQWARYLPTMFGPAAARAVAAAPAVAPDGWSNGDDSRALRTPTTAWPWRTISQSTFSATDTQSRCTMTYVGPRHLITAAHCLVDFGTSNWKARTLTPGRDGQNVMPYGQTQITPNPPAGVESWYIVPDPWLDPNTNSSGTEEFQWDIGMVLTVDRLGEQTGWMGYGAFPSTDLNTRNQLNRGYPRCDVQEAPDSCQAHRLYGDSEYCEIGYYHHPGSNGWNREFAFSCDISRGHSGSPLYHYRWIPSWNATGPYVAAVVSWHECLDDAQGECDEDDDFPNHARRITPWVRDALSWLREEFP
ncbi:MAG: hypothetical protein MUC34_05725 [Anaerolineae bacterium]|nr:hypothetical protein [Anaerolineae bacterium]